MPYANLLIAQAASSWIAAPYVAALALNPEDATYGPYFWYIIAALGALIIWIGGYIGARISKSICKPTFATLLFAVAFALLGALVAATFIAPHVQEQRIWAELFTVTPVLAALAGYMLHRGTAQC